MKEPSRQARGEFREAPLDARLVPVATAVWVGAWLGTADSVSPLAGAACAVAMLLAVAPVRRRPWPVAGPRRRPPALVVVVTLFASGAVGLLHHRAVTTGSLAGWAAEGASCSVVAVVRTDPVWTPAAGTRPARTTFGVRLVSVTARGRVLRTSDDLAVMASGGLAGPTARLSVGERIAFDARLQPRRDGDPSVGSLRLRGGLRLLSPPSLGAGVVNRLRTGLREAMRWSPTDQRQLVPSLVVGDRSQVPDSMTVSFKATGLTHLMAVSGTNLALALSFVLVLVRAVGLPRTLRRVVALGTVAGFVVVCRAEPSVVRAAAMGLVTLSATGPRLAGRRGARHLCVAVIVLLLWNPWLARTAGFQLSVAATAGIVWWGSPWQRALAERCPAWLAEALAVPIAAQLATQPVVTAISGSVSVVGLLANALAAPFVGPATVVGLAAMGLQPLVPVLACACGWCAGWCVWPILLLADWLAGLPGAVAPWPATPLSLALLTAACALLARVLPRLVAMRWGWVAMALAALVLPWVRPPQPGWPGAWRVVFCDVGQGDSTVLRVGRDAAVVVDVGPDSTASADCLRALGVRQVPLLVLTHFHADHVGGLAHVLDAVAVGQVLVNPLRSPSGDVAHVESVLAAHHVSERTASQTETDRVGDGELDVLGGGPLPGLEALAGEGESPAENNSSLALVLRGGGLSVLVAGDAEPLEQQALLDGGVDDTAMVLKMPHHGSARQLPEFWHRSGAVLAVASAGLHNDYGHPAAAALRLAAACGMRVARTDQQGSIAVWVDAGRLQLRTQFTDRS